jgi:hypothetical protein
MPAISKVTRATKMLEQVASGGRQIFTAWPPKRKLNEIRRKMTDHS